MDHLDSVRHDCRFVLRGRWDDRPIAPGSLSRAFKWLIQALDMDPAITIYSLRHSYATELLRNTISNLPPEERAVFLLKQDLGQTYEQVAQALSCSVRTAKYRMKSALERIALSAERLGVEG